MTRAPMWSALLFVLSVSPLQAAVWSSSGPAPARITRLKFDPTAPSTLYAGTQGGVVLRSDDGGITWRRTARTGDDVIVDLDVRGQTLLAGTDAFSVGGVGGVFRSLDGGASWAYAGTAAGFGSLSVRAVAIDPFATTTMLAGTQSGLNGGLFRSVDGGASWVLVPVPTGTQISDILFDPAVPGLVYVSTFNSGVSRSLDHGASFVPFNTGAATSIDGLALDGGTLWAPSFSDFFRTATAAASWTSAAEGLPTQLGIFEVGVTAAGLLAPAGNAIYGTRTSFVSWGLRPTPGFSASGVAVDPLVSTRLFVYGGGLAGSVDAGNTWERLDDIPGLAVERVVAMGPRSVLVAGDTALLRSDDGGASFTPATNGLTNLGLQGLVSDPVDPDRAYTSVDQKLFTTADAGRTWSALDFGITISTLALAVAPSDPRVLYGATFTGAIGVVRRSADRGQTWQPAMGGLSMNFPQDVAVDPTNPDVVYLSADGHLFVTSDGGSLWSPADTGLTGAPGAIVVDPVEPATLYVAAGGTVWRSANRGGSWQPTPALPGSPAPTDLLVDPTSHATVYVATTQGVFRSSDAGGTWQPLSGGLPNLHVRAIVLDREHATLYAATDGGLAVASFGVVVGDTTLPVKKRIATLGLGCGGAEAAACEGAVRLTTVPRPNGKTREVAAAKFSVQPDATATVPLKLKRLTVRRKRDVEADLTIEHGGERSTVRVRLRRS